MQSKISPVVQASYPTKSQIPDWTNLCLKKKKKLEKVWEKLA